MERATATEAGRRRRPTGWATFSAALGVSFALLPVFQWPLAAGNVRGPQRFNFTLRDWGQKCFNVTFREGEPAVVRAYSEEGKPIDIEVFLGREQVTEEEGPEGVVEVRWTPEETRTYRVCVDSNVRSRVHCTLETN